MFSPIPPRLDPQQIFSDLFSALTPGADTTAIIQRKKSILDFIDRQVTWSAFTDQFAELRRQHHVQPHPAASRSAADLQRPFLRPDAGSGYHRHHPTKKVDLGFH